MHTALQEVVSSACLVGLSLCVRLNFEALLSPHICYHFNSESAASQNSNNLASPSEFSIYAALFASKRIAHVTCLLGHVIELRTTRSRQLFLSSNPKQTNMADCEERRSLLGGEDEVSLSGSQTPRGPGRPMPAICDPNHLLHRVVVLVFMCFLGFGELENTKFPKHPE